MQKIVPHLWFDKEAKEAAEFYVSVFPESKIDNVTTLHDTPSGDCDTVTFTLWGQDFMAISAGPYFKLNPSISFMVNFDPSRDATAREHLDEIWAKLSEGGKALMPLDTYPFSEHYGWIQDKYGVTWQLILTKAEGEERPPMIPSIMFVQEVNGKAQEATDFYLSVFKNAPHAKGETRRGTLAFYPEAMPDRKGELMFTDFELEGQWLTAMDGGTMHEFTFNEAISILVRCEDQQELDYFWDKLSADPKAEQCGWLKDKYGLSWQITSSEMDEMMRKGTQAQIDAVTQAFMPMHKIDIATIKTAFDSAA